jgi:hypothetical protein
MASYQFTLDINVHDPEALYRKAVEACRADGLSGAFIDDMLLPGGEVQVKHCLAAILDPGTLPGCTIYGHEVEMYHAEFADTDGDGL